MIKILQWNAGGLSQSKTVELNKIVTDNNKDIFFIQEANLSPDQIKYFNFTGFSLKLLPKKRQISSGILVGIRNGISSSFEIMKEMGTDDTSELVKINLWIQKNHFKLYSIYNPPRNIPDLSTIKTKNKAMIIGDFNGHSKRWGYKNIDATGKIIEDFLNTTTFELIYRTEDPPTFIHFSGSGSNPDLLLASSDITRNIK